MKRFKLSPFTKTKITFTLWYSFVLFIILVAFSIFTYTLETQDVTRIVLLRDYGTNVPKTLTQGEKDQILLQINEVKKSFIIDLVLVDDIVLLLGAFISFFLSGIALKPIRESFQRQKEFMADASHELRTPITAIQTAAEVSLRKSKQKEDYKRVVMQTLKETQRMSRMIDELIQLSRADTGIARFFKTKINLEDTLSEVTDELTPLAAKKRISLNQTLEKVIINADSERIKQLAIIILDNAIKYTPNGGRIEIKTGKKNRKPYFQVTDNGIGIPKTEQEKIFYRFYRIDKSRSQEGAGLGLSIAKWIADLHQAEIQVKSNKGKGSTFKVVFKN